MKKKVLIAVCALALVLVVAVGGTVAWLTDKTAEVKNTFTYGDINIALDETTGQEYKMVPGNDIKKDPKVTVKAESEDCWLFVEVKKSDNFDDFMAYNIAEGWTELANETGVYYREVKNKADNQSFGVLQNDTVTVKEDVTKEKLKALTDEAKKPTLTFTAYAVQMDKNKEAIDTAAEAWDLVNN